MIRLSLMVNGTTRQYAFHRTEISVGRSPLNDLSLMVEGLSARHGRLWRHDGRWFYEDLESLSGSALVRGAGSEPIRGTRPVQEGDILSLGTSVRLELMSLGEREAWGAALIHHPLEGGALDGELPEGCARRLAALALAQARAPEAAALVDGAATLFGAALGTPVRGVGLLRHGGGPMRLMWRGQSDEMEPAALELDPADRDRFMELLAQPGLILHPTAQGGTRLLVTTPRSVDSQATALVIEPGGPLGEEALAVVRKLGEAVAPLLSGLARERTHRERIEALRAENRYFRERQRRHYLFKELVTESEAMRRVYARLGELVSRQGPVVLVGEAGTGKELIARAVHHLGARSHHLMVTQGCAAVDPTLLELELFGAGRGQQGAQPGILELANGGTVFLNQIERLPALLQARLLRVIKEGEVRRHGEGVARRVDVRLVLATHRDLAELVAEGLLRRELVAALQESILEVPPLRQRREDIEPLTRIFLEVFARRHGIPTPTLDAEAGDLLRGHRWPGNVRELQAIVESALLRCEGNHLGASDFGFLAGGQPEL